MLNIVNPFSMCISTGSCNLNSTGFPADVLSHFNSTGFPTDVFHHTHDLECKEYKGHSTPTSWEIYCKLMSAACPVQPGGFSLPQMAFRFSGISQSDSPCSLWLLLAVVLPTWGHHDIAFPLPKSSKVLSHHQNGWKKWWKFHEVHGISPAFSMFSRDFPDIPSPQDPTRHLRVGGTQFPGNRWQGWPGWFWHKIWPKNGMIGSTFWDEMKLMAGIFGGNLGVHDISIFPGKKCRLSEDDLQRLRPGLTLYRCISSIPSWACLNIEHTQILCFVHETVVIIDCPMKSTTLWVQVSSIFIFRNWDLAHFLVVFLRCPSEQSWQC